MFNPPSGLVVHQYKVHDGEAPYQDDNRNVKACNLYDRVRRHKMRNVILVIVMKAHWVHTMQP